MAEHGLPITTKMAQGFAWTIAIPSGTQGYSNEEIDPGRHRWNNFRVSHPDLHLHTANNLEHNQAGALNREVADNYFACLKTTMENSGPNGSWQGSICEEVSEHSCQLFDYYDDSSVRTAGLQDIQSLRREKGAFYHQMAQPERSVMRLKTPVVLNLQNDAEQRGDAKALGLASLISECRFVCTMLLLCDTLPHITFLSKAFQSADCIILQMLPATLQSRLLEALKEANWTNLAGLEMYIEELNSAGIKFKMLLTLGPSYCKNSIQLPY